MSDHLMGLYGEACGAAVALHNALLRMEDEQAASFALSADPRYRVTGAYHLTGINEYADLIIQGVPEGAGAWIGPRSRGFLHRATVDDLVRYLKVYRCQAARRWVLERNGKPIEEAPDTDWREEPPS